MKKFLLVFASVLFILAGCSSNEEQQSVSVDNEAEAEEEQVTVNLRNIYISEENNHIKIEGEARATDDTFYYQVEQDDSLLIEETQISMDKTNLGWGEFEIDLEEEEKMRENEKPPFMVFYVKNEDGEKINVNYVPIDLN